jgi:hypothetical protein
MDRKTRRFGLGDLMVLIAAIGAAMVALRNLWHGLTVEPGARYWSVTPARLIVAATLAACATPLTLACLAFRVRKPRPTWRRVAIQPGTAALVACAVTFAVQMLDVAVSFSAPPKSWFGARVYAPIRFSDSNYVVLVRSFSGNGVIGHIEPMACFGVLVASFALPCGPAVAAVWLVLALSGRWRPERSWIDRLGRTLGAIWIIIAIVTALPM